VRSVHGVGSTFYVDLPLAKVVLPPAEDGPGRGPAGDAADGATTHTVLYIEDNPSNTMLMRRIFARRPQVRLLVAGDGEVGLAMTAEHRPDLILLDLHLPGCGGEEVLAQIRLDAELAPTPVVIVTADLAPGTERRLMQAGATAFLSKPVDIGLVLDLIDRMVQRA